MALKNPPHPGEFVRTEIIDPAGLCGEMALRIEKAFGVKMDTLMRMHSSYDIAQMRMRAKDIYVRRIRETADIHL